MTLEDLNSYWKIQSIPLELKKISVGVLAGLFLAFLTPYDTRELGGFWSIASYWVGACVLGGMLSRPVALLSFKYSLKKQHSLAVAFLLFSLLGTIPVFIMVVTGETIGNIMYVMKGEVTWENFKYVLDLEISDIPDFLFWYLQVYVICFFLFSLITVVMYISEKRQVQESGINAPPAGYKFLKRLPAALGQNLLCLTVEDHYVRAYTDKGNELLLLRFRDAVDELDGFSGFQCHRSWWVSTKAIATCDKGQRRYELTLVNEMKIPVSKTFEDELRSLGYI